MNASTPNVLLLTPRLVVRRFAPHDIDPFHTYRNDEEVARFQGWELPYTHEQAVALVEEMVTIEWFTPGAWTQLAIVERDNLSMLVGDLGVRVEAEEPTAEIGFTLARQSWGRGFATEAVTAVVEHLLGAQRMERVVAFTLVDNERAQRVLAAAGLQIVARDGDELVFYRRA